MDGDDSSVEAAKPRIWAHRGSALLAPENTALAFDLALELGADVLETDVRLSRDGAVMVVHDARLERTTDGRGRVRDSSSARIGALDAGARFVDPDGRCWRGRGARVETLDALLERYPDTALSIDIKDAEDAAADAVAACLARRPGTGSVTVGSFHERTLARFRERAPEVDTAASRAEVAALWCGRVLPGTARAAPRYRRLQIPPRWWGLSLATRGFIGRAAERGVDCVYWTINDPGAMRELVRRGAAGVVTDRPDLAARAFERSAGGAAR